MSEATPKVDLTGAPIVLKCRGAFQNKEGTLYKWDGGDLATVELKGIDMGWGSKRVAEVVHLNLPARAVYLKSTNHYLGQEDIEAEVAAPISPEAPSSTPPATAPPAL